MNTVPTHVIVQMGAISTTPVEGIEGPLPVVVFADNSYTNITEEAAKNWTPNGQMSFGQAMCAAMHGYRVGRVGDVRVIQHHLTENAMAVNIGKQSFTEFVPTNQDMVANDWRILDVALLGRGYAKHATHQG